MVASLACFSEPFPPHGALAAEGAENLLGRPRLDPLTVLVREAIQNSWDARRDDRGVVDVALRGLSLGAGQIRALREQVFAGVPPAAVRLREVLARGDVLLLSLTDTGTTGLGGPVRADRPPLPGEATDFVDLVFNIGQPSERTFGGGSYGFGKTISFVVSEARAVVVHSRTMHEGRPQSRFIAACFSDHFGVGAQRFTGRHWWGRPVDASVEPVVGDDADALAASVGLVPFGPDETGTTIAVVAPDLRGRSASQAMRFLADAITWNFWPKMLPSAAGGAPSMAFAVDLDDEPIAVRRPDQLPPLGAYADALRAVRQAERTGIAPSGGRVQVTEIRSTAPVRRLGWLGMTRTTVLPRQPLDVGVDELAGLGEADAFVGVSHHIALLRQPELVVEYVEGPELPLLDTEWAAIFKADRELDAAFAAAEPPTHDGWEPSLVSAGPNRRFVLAALLALRDAANEYGIPRPESTEDGRRSAVLVAEALGGLLEHQPSAQERIPPELPDAVVFTGLAMAAAGDGRRLLEVGFAVGPVLRQDGRGPGRGDGVDPEATAVLDGSAEVAAGPDARASAGAWTRRRDATVLGFVDHDERWAVEGPALEVGPDRSRRWWARIDAPADAAVTVELVARPAGERASRLVVLPHWSATAVQGAAWKLAVHGVSHPAGGHLTGWDFETPLEAGTTVRVDLEQVRDECGLGPSDRLALVGSWFATATNRRGRGVVVDVTAAGDHELQFPIAPGEAGGRLRLERRLVLVGPGTADDPFAARAPGSVLWSDPPVATALDEDVARFPTEAVDFGRAPIATPEAAWWLDAHFDALDASPHHALRLFVNAEHPALDPLLAGSNEPVAQSVRSVLRWQIVRALVVGALDSDELVARASSTGFDSGTLGASLLRLVERHFPDRSLDALQRTYRADPSRFDLLLQARVGLWASLEPGAPS